MVPLQEKKNGMVSPGERREVKYLCFLFTNNGKRQHEIDKGTGSAEAFIVPLCGDEAGCQFTGQSLSTPMDHNLWVMMDRIRSRVQVVEMRSYKDATWPASARTISGMSHWTGH